MKKLNTALLALGLVFLAWLIWKAGARDLWRQMGTLGWGILLIVVVEGLANLAHTVAWRRCIHDPDKRVSLTALFQMNMAGWAINYLTPTASVGGEVSRATLLASTQKGAHAATSVLLDKLMSAIGQLVVICLGLLCLPAKIRLPVALWVAMGVTTVLLISGITVFLFLQKYGKLGAFCRWLARRKLGGRPVQQAAETMSKVDEVLKGFYQERPRGLVLSVVWHTIGHSAAIAQAWLFLYMLAQPAPLTTVAAVGSLSLWFDLLTFAIPMNLGTLEGSRIVVLKSLGCQALLGMAFGIAVRVGQLFWACFGLLSYSVLTARQKAGIAKRSTEPSAMTSECRP